MLNISEGANMALHALAYLSGKGESSITPAAVIARELGVSREHLGKVLLRFVKLGHIKSRRGPRGGFQIKKDTDQISVLVIIEAIDGQLEMGCSLCRRTTNWEACKVRVLRERIYQDVHRNLSRTRLADLVPSSTASDRSA